MLVPSCVIGFPCKYMYWHMLERYWIRTDIAPCYMHITSNGYSTMKFVYTRIAFGPYDLLIYFMQWYLYQLSYCTPTDIHILCQTKKLVCTIIFRNYTLEDISIPILRSFNHSNCFKVILKFGFYQSCRQFFCHYFDPIVHVEPVGFIRTGL